MINKYAEINKRIILYKAASGILRLKRAFYGSPLDAIYRTTKVIGNKGSKAVSSDNKLGILGRLKKLIWRKKVKPQSTALTPVNKPVEQPVVNKPVTNTPTPNTTAPNTGTPNTTTPNTTTPNTTTPNTGTQKPYNPNETMAWVLPSVVGASGVGLVGWNLYNNR